MNIVPVFRCAGLFAPDRPGKPREVRVLATVVSLRVAAFTLDGHLLGARDQHDRELMVALWVPDIVHLTMEGWLRVASHHRVHVIDTVPCTVILLAGPT